MLPVPSIYYVPSRQLDSACVRILRELRLALHQGDEIVRLKSFECARHQTPLTAIRIAASNKM